jgi:hypothetical protein
MNIDFRGEDMQICCTKKLLDEAGIVAEKASEEKDLFCWSVHLLTFNRRKTVVAVNDSNRFGFILHGLKVKDFKSLKGHMLQGIRSCLQDEKIDEGIIEQYLEAAGDPVFTKTRGPKYVSRLNKACEMVEIFNDMLDPGQLFQYKIGRTMNSDLIKIDKASDYERPHELLKMDLKNFAGKEIIRCEALDLMIKLDLGRYTAWRRIMTPADITFRQLHEILQAVFDWKSQHIYDFKVFDQTDKLVLRVISENEEVYESSADYRILYDTEVSFTDFAQKDFRIIYCYDYGDNWEHEITYQGTVYDYNKNYPVCLMGEGNPPPEDIGGISGYGKFLDIMADPGNERYRNVHQWAQSQWYNDFDMDLTNRKLKNILR